MGEESESSNSQESLDAKDYFEQYWRYCSSLRNWFVAYGIGGCILFLSDKAKVFQGLTNTKRTIIVIFFLVGVIAQIVLAFFNKWIHWYIYWGKEKIEFQETKRYKVANYLSSIFEIDVAVDMITFATFVVATIVLIAELRK